MRGDTKPCLPTALLRLNQSTGSYRLERNDLPDSGAAEREPERKNREGEGLDREVASEDWNLEIGGYYPAEG